MACPSCAAACDRMEWLPGALNGHHGRLRRDRTVGGRVAVLQRLIALLLLATASCGTLALTAVSTNEYRSNNSGSYPWVTTYLAACQQRFSGYSAGRLVSQNETSANLECWQGSIWVAQNGFSRRVIYSCPANSTLSGSTCTCNSGYVEQGGACVEPLDPAEEYCTQQSTNPAVGVSAPRPASSSGLGTYTMCYSNQYSLYACSGTMTPDICGQGPDGKWHCTGKVTFSGSEPCTGTTNPQTPEAVPAPLPSAPPPGQCPGEVNGVAVNVPCSSTVSSSTKSNETTNSSGTTQKSESRNTTCNAAGSCTTTVTTTTVVNGGSPSTSTSTTTQGKGEFCAENPGSRECAQESSFSGTCQSAFVCQGDAVQCATAKAVNDHLCKFNNLFEMDGPTQALAQSVLDGTHVANPKDSPQVINVGMFDQSSPISTACPADVPFTLSGMALSIPLSQYCAQLQLMGNILVLFTLLGATVYVFRGST